MGPSVSLLGNARRSAATRSPLETKSATGARGAVPRRAKRCLVLCARLANALLLRAALASQTGQPGLYPSLANRPSTLSAITSTTSSTLRRCVPLWRPRCCFTVCTKCRTQPPSAQVVHVARGVYVCARARVCARYVPDLQCC